MNALMRWLCKLIGLEEMRPMPAVHHRTRVTCEFCGKSIAVIKSTGALWRHHCQKTEAR